MHFFENISCLKNWPLRMKDKQILMHGNFDGFEKSISTELTLWTGALDQHRKQGMTNYKWIDVFWFLSIQKNAI